MEYDLPQKTGAVCRNSDSIELHGRTLMGQLFTVVITVAWLAGMVSWCALVFYLFKIFGCAKAGVSIWGRATMWRPFNLVLLPHLLTEDGRNYRKKFFLALLVFVGSIGLGITIGFALQEI